MKIAMGEILQKIRAYAVSAADLDPHEPLEQALTAARGDAVVTLLRSLAGTRDDAQRALLDQLIDQQAAYDAAHPEAVIRVDVEEGYL